ncbi:MAG TPA: hypothetical protein VIM51_03760 [Desulfosporosinus sp.]
MGKRRNRYIGKWVETGWKTVDLPYAASNLLMLLDQASIDEHGGYTHQDIVNWCLQYCRKFFEDDDKELLDKHILSSHRGHG